MGILHSVVRSLLFQPPRATYEDHDGLVWLSTSLGESVPCIHVPHPRARWTIIFSHANSEDLGYVHEWANELSYHLNVNVLIYDYTGYGISTGSPSEESCCADIEAVWTFATERLKVPPNRIVVYGRSLGSGPSIDIALRKSVRACIVQSAFASVYRVGLGSESKSLSDDMFCNVDKVSKLKVPLFIIHGTKDPLVPVTHAEALHAGSKASEAEDVDPLWIQEGSHNNLEIYWKQVLLRRIMHFLQTLENQDLIHTLRSKERAIRGVVAGMNPVERMAAARGGQQSSNNSTQGWNNSETREWSWSVHMGDTEGLKDTKEHSRFSDSTTGGSRFNTKLSYSSGTEEQSGEMQAGMEHEPYDEDEDEEDSAEDSANLYNPDFIPPSGFSSAAGSRRTSIAGSRKSSTPGGSPHHTVTGSSIEERLSPEALSRHNSEIENPLLVGGSEALASTRMASFGNSQDGDRSPLQGRSAQPLIPGTSVPTTFADTNPNEPLSRKGKLPKLDGSHRSQATDDSIATPSLGSVIEFPEGGLSSLPALPPVAEPPQSG